MVDYNIHRNYWYNSKRKQLNYPNDYPLHLQMPSFSKCEIYTKFRQFIGFMCGDFIQCSASGSVSQFIRISIRERIRNRRENFSFAAFDVASASVNATTAAFLYCLCLFSRELWSIRIIIFVLLKFFIESFVCCCVLLDYMLYALYDIDNFYFISFFHSPNIDSNWNKKVMLLLHVKIYKFNYLLHFISQYMDAECRCIPIRDNKRCIYASNVFI